MVPRAAVGWSWCLATIPALLRGFGSEEGIKAINMSFAGDRAQPRSGDSRGDVRG